MLSSAGPELLLERGPSSALTGLDTLCGSELRCGLGLGFGFGLRSFRACCSDRDVDGNNVGRPRKLVAER